MGLVCENCVICEPINAEMKPPRFLLSVDERHATKILRFTVNSDSLQDTLYNLTQSGTRANPALNTLLHDYIKFHAVLVIEGGIFTFILIVLSAYFWRQLEKMQNAKSRNWTFEKKTYFCFGLVSTVVSLFILLIVAANLSNVLNPQKGFVQFISDLGTPQVGTQKAALHQAVNIWALSGSAQMPSILQNGVNDRLAWQRPKAIVCSILPIVGTVFTVCLWQRLIKNSRVSGSIWSLKGKALITIGVIAVPIMLLLIIMAAANMQASFAPITLTLL